MEGSTRQKLIDTYLSLGEEHGFDTVSLSALSKEVGITKSTIFSHFSGSEDLHNAAIEYCRTVIAETSINVDFSANDLQSLFVRLINRLVDVFTSFPRRSYLSYLDQKHLTDSNAQTLSNQLDSMIRARILVALDYAVQRSWISINDTDAVADILTPYFRRGLTNTDESYWDSLLDFLKNL